MPGGVRTEIHLSGQDTGGVFCVLIDHPPARWSLPAHRHRGEAETIHVIDGAFEMQIDGRHVLLSAGETVHIPARTVHSGRNSGGHGGRRLIIFSPAGMEQFFMDVGTATPDAETDPARVLASAAEHGWEFLVGNGRSSR